MTSAGTSVKSPSTVKELKSKKIPLSVSEKLQNQITFLCSEVYSDEWSGTLFYTVEGDLGEDNFQINAEELYLQDIGNSTYTEYDPSNPDFIKFLMENPRFMEMRQGHIHSHNTMAVFFSATDNSELIDNSPFHNYYVSLIVNNKNEMCAKIAFRATEIKETKSTVSFKGTDGTTKSKEVLNKAEEEAVYAYTCEISIPDTVGESFNSRFLEVKGSCEKREEEAKKSKILLAKEAKAVEKGLASKGDMDWARETAGDPRDKAYGGFDGSKRYSQAGLYDDVRPIGGGSKKKAMGQEKRGWTGSVEISAPKLGGKADPNIYNFLVKLLTRDFLSEERLSLVLSKLNKDLYSPEYAHRDGEDNMYFDSLNAVALSHYINCFPDDFHVTNYNKVLGMCVEMLEAYESTYPELIENLSIALNFCMDEE